MRCVRWRRQYHPGDSLRIIARVPASVTLCRMCREVGLTTDRAQMEITPGEAEGSEENRPSTNPGTVRSPQSFACVGTHAASHTNGSPRSRTSPHGGASEESKTTAGYGYRGPNESLGDGRKAAPPPARRETTPGTMAWCHFNPVSEGASGPGVHIPRRWQHGDEPLARTLSPAAALLVCDNRQKLGENPVGPPSRGRPRAWVRVDRCLLQERPTPGASEGGAHHAERNFELAQFITTRAFGKLF